MENVFNKIAKSADRREHLLGASDELSQEITRLKDRLSRLREKAQYELRESAKLVSTVGHETAFQDAFGCSSHSVLIDLVGSWARGDN